MKKKASKREKTARAKSSSRAPRRMELEAVDEAATESPAELARRNADAMVGDEAAGGTVSTPDHDQVDEWAASFGVERSPDSPVRSSAELLSDRDRRRGGRRPRPTL